MKPPRILSRDNFSEMMNCNHLSDGNVEELLGGASSFISITGNIDQEEHYFNKNHSNVLNLRFDDIEHDELDVWLADSGYTLAKGISEEQASIVLDFIIANKDTDFIIHCAAGVSRSAAIGRFIVDLFDLDYPLFRKINPNIHPNGRVLSLLKAEASKRELL